MPGTAAAQRFRALKQNRDALLTRTFFDLIFSLGKLDKRLDVRRNGKYVNDINIFYLL